MNDQPTEDQTLLKLLDKHWRKHRTAAGVQRTEGRDTEALHCDRKASALKAVIDEYEAGQ